MSFKWTEELKQAAVDQYVAANPTAENSMEIIQEIAAEVGASPNGVRVILSKANVYVAKAAKESGDKKETKAAGGTRVSKEGAQEALKNAIEAAGHEADMEIISKLTGKAAQYLTGIFTKA